MKSTVYGFHNKSNSIHPRHLRNANARRREKATPPSTETTVDFTIQNYHYQLRQR